MELFVNYLPHGWRKENLRDKYTKEHDKFIELYLTEVVKDCVLK